jgi:tyrosine-protein phosphatase SIW14
MPRFFGLLFALLITALLIGGPIGYSLYRQAQARNFRMVRDGVLYRSGQMTLAGLKRVVRDYHIKTVVTLRDSVHEGETPPDWKEEQFCKAEEILYCRIRPERWWASDDTVPAEKGVRRFLHIMDKQDNYPVLVHCFAGIHRTGAYCAIYRMEYQGWNNTAAIAEMRACGYANINDEFDLLGYLEKYQPRQLPEKPSPSAQAGRPAYWATARPVLRPRKHKRTAGAQGKP